ncbi:Uncharacterised protein [Mycobacteroides abscessus subsp. abscessus]|nr:Uncharacterised protein [Mycobacteroides abscessus subsp. abscessus]
MAAATRRCAVSGSAMSPNATSISVPPCRICSIAASASGFGALRPLRMIRPTPAAASLRARNNPSPPRPPVTT